MKEIVEHLGEIAWSIGLLYLMVRFIIHGYRNSYIVEIRKILNFEYLRLIRKNECKKVNERLLFNAWLTIFYIVFGISMISLFIHVIIQVS